MMNQSYLPESLNGWDKTRKSAIFSPQNSGKKTHSFFMLFTASN
jgi:hypothetical protein